MRSKIKIIFSAWILLVILFIFSSCNRIATYADTIDFEQYWDSLALLENPDKGWYYELPFDRPLKDKRDSAFLKDNPVVKHIYLDLPWKYLEPKEGNFNWQLVDEFVNEYILKNYKIDFRISTMEWIGNDGTGRYRKDEVIYTTPKWVRKSGTEGNFCLISGTKGVRAWIPKRNDPVYLEKLNNFHKAFAARYEQEPWIGFVEMGDIGELCNADSAIGVHSPLTLETFKPTIDIFLTHYKHTQIVLNTESALYVNKTEEIQKIFDYCISNGLTLRNKGLVLARQFAEIQDKVNTTQSLLYDSIYLNRPILLDLGGNNTIIHDSLGPGIKASLNTPVQSGNDAELYKNAIKKTHASYIGYHDNLELFIAENPDLAAALFNLCGYWYFPVSVEFQRVMTKGKQTISFTWLNKGAAPAYKNFGMVVSFVNKENSERSNILIPDVENVQWLPDVPIEVSYTFEIPINMPDGSYDLKFKLKDLGSEQQQDVFLPLNKSILDCNHFILLGEIQLKR